VLLDIGVKGLVRNLTVYTELRWGVFGMCGVFGKKVLKFGCTIL
jgi:hypothetical protein